jgi:PLP dependent protein
MIAGNISHLRERIAAAAHRAGRAPTDITLVAVTKTYPAGDALEAMRAGVLDLGENRVQEATPKIAELCRLDPSNTPRWHLIGHLQSNKAKVAIQNFELIHSVDSLSLARELNRQAAALRKHQRILMQANVSGEESKFGLNPAELETTLQDVLSSCPSLIVEGFMTMAPLVEDPEQTRPVFRALRDLSVRLAASIPATSQFQPRHLSMGMTNDFEVGIEEGATLIRVGSAIFGSRS